MEVYQVNQMLVKTTQYTPTALRAVSVMTMKKGLTHGGGCQTAKQLTRSASAEGK
jgi:hypothetical protein